jgi:hypothetical protein
MIETWEKSGFLPVTSRQLLINMKVHEESKGCGITSCQQWLATALGGQDFSTSLSFGTDIGGHKRPWSDVWAGLEYKAMATREIYHRSQSNELLGKGALSTPDHQIGNGICYFTSKMLLCVSLVFDLRRAGAELLARAKQENHVNEKWPSTVSRMQKSTSSVARISDRTHNTGMMG